jgi:hypothetical protein
MDFEFQQFTESSSTFDHLRPPSSTFVHHFNFPRGLAANPKASAAGEGFAAPIWQKLIASDVNC